MVLGKAKGCTNTYIISLMLADLVMIIKGNLMKQWNDILSLSIIIAITYIAGLRDDRRQKINLRGIQLVTL
jgi:hypothetical protein